MNTLRLIRTDSTRINVAKIVTFRTAGDQYVSYTNRRIEFLIESGNESNHEIWHSLGTSLPEGVDGGAVLAQMADVVDSFLIGDRYWGNCVLLDLDTLEQSVVKQIAASIAQPITVQEVD